MAEPAEPAEAPAEPPVESPAVPPDGPKMKPSSVKAILMRKRKEKGIYHPDDEALFDPANAPEEGAGIAILHQMAGRIVTLHPGNTVRKSGRGVKLYEADALCCAEQAGVPVPHVYGTETTADGRNHITMSYIEGQTLDKVWDALTGDERKALAQQLRAILVTMQALAPPADYIGSCDGKAIRDTRAYSTYTAPPVATEQAFVDGPLLGGLPKKIPTAIYNAFALRLHAKTHRVVLTHGDLSPRNIVVRDKRVAAILDWEHAGWYPEYWEYVKFLHRFGGHEGYWAAYAEDIFPTLFPEELVDYIALTKWQP